MKFFATIMVLVILMQSVLPCVDNITTVNTTLAKVEISKSTTQHNEGQNDTCSPFCTCACCAGMTDNLLLPSVSSVEFFSKKTFPSFLPDGTLDTAVPIWQPPQLLA
ncbi:MAG: hypothetical protein DI535_03695 [Citrobacter freundii]|nr:MAG: hypothetical protein DI535_03695 [Citrobacter freundii]